MHPSGNPPPPPPPLPGGDDVDVEDNFCITPNKKIRTGLSNMKDEKNEMLAEQGLMQHANTASFMKKELGNMLGPDKQVVVKTRKETITEQIVGCTVVVISGKHVKTGGIVAKKHSRHTYICIDGLQPGVFLRDISILLNDKGSAFKQATTKKGLQYHNSIDDINFDDSWVEKKKIQTTQYILVQATLPDTIPQYLILPSNEKKAKINLGNFDPDSSEAAWCQQKADEFITNEYQGFVREFLTSNKRLPSYEDIRMHLISIGVSITFNKLIVYLILIL